MERERERIVLKGSDGNGAMAGACGVQGGQGDAARGWKRIGVSSSAEPIQTRNLSYQFLLGGVAKSSGSVRRSLY